MEPDREPFDPELLARAEVALREMPAESDFARAYLAKHIPRLARTMAMVPLPQSKSRVLELGCYMQITPLFDRIRGYKEVRGAYYGAKGKMDRKEVEFPDREFICYIDHFDAERDRFPYSDGHFDLVVAGEIIEHMVYDPMHLLLESRRVLIDGGFLLVTTPNAAGIASIAKALEGRANPMIFPRYKLPDPKEPPEAGHMHEYTAFELGETVKAAGFEICSLFTTFLEEYEGHRHLMSLLETNGYDVTNRGEQTWCLAVKRAGLPVDRFPSYLYGS